MSSFKEFLEKEKHIMAADLGIGRSAKEKFIERLGEYAFRQYQILFGSPESGTSEMYVWLEIAVACLGEVEVKKRLEAW